MLFRYRRSQDDSNVMRHVVSLVAVGCRGSESARKYNLQHTVTIKVTSITRRGLVSDDNTAEIEAQANAIVQSFRLTVGPICYGF